MELHKVLLLPIEIRRIIISYMGYPETPAYRAVKEELRIYYNDHSWYQTQYHGKYHIDYIFPFSKYYFHKRTNPTEYLTTYGYI